MNTDWKKEGKREWEMGGGKGEDHERKRVYGVWHLGHPPWKWIPKYHFCGGFHHRSSKFSLTTVYSHFTAAYLWIFKGLMHNDIDNHSSLSRGNNYSLGVLSLAHFWVLRKGFPCSYIKKLEAYWNRLPSIAGCDFFNPLKMPLYLIIS